MARLALPGIPYGTGAVFESACVVGAGRVGKAVAARLGERIPTRVAGRDVDCGDADLVLLCVPDGEIAKVAEKVQPGPWIAHTGGSASVADLRGHERRFSLHPLQTFVLERGPEQLDGSWAAVSGETPEALDAGRALAELLRIEPFELPDGSRALYHAAAMMASSFVVTLHDFAARWIAAAGGPPEALTPLTLRTIENGYRHTGPLVRGDMETIRRDDEAVERLDPHGLVLFANLVKAEAQLLTEGAS
jgi:predicted short-subunit dehydrogenase-like oxidoreductase (DUF2520 family)